MQHVKVGVIFLGRKRPGFDMDWGSALEEQVRQAVRLPGLEVFYPTKKVVDDPSLRAALAEFQKAGVEALVLLQTTMSDGRMSPTIAQLWPDRPILWATPENPEVDKVSSCSLVGAHLWASAFRHLGRTCETICGHPQDSATRASLAEAVARVTCVRKLRALRMALVGTQAPGFFNMQGDLFSMHRELGMQLQTHTLSEFGDILNAIDDRAVADDVVRVKQLGLQHKDTSDEDLPMASRLYLAMRHFFEVEKYDALAVRCWPEMPNIYGQWPYLGMARLSDEGLAIAPEGDVDGALSGWIGERLGMGHYYLTDWLEHDRSTITFWHGGMSPMSLSPPQGEPGSPRIARHFNSEKPAVLDAELKADMPVTIWRLWRYEGKYRLAVREGRTLRPRRPLMGTNALVLLDQCDPNAWFKDLCHHAMPHHVSIHEGHHADNLQQFARLLEVEVVCS
jgi:L-fucose isomerase-like protein